MTRLVHVCNDSLSTPRDMVDVITLDPGLTLKLMRTQVLGRSVLQNYKSLESAVAVLGRRGVKNIALNVLTSPLSNPILKKSHVNFSQFWYHSIKCGLLARHLAEIMPGLDVTDAYLAGLLHDVGKLVLWANFGSDYEPIVRKPPMSNEIQSVENDAIGTNHCETGWNLMRSVRAKPFIADAVLYHHWPAREVSRAFPLVKTVYAANIFVHRPQNAAYIEWLKEIGFDPDSAAVKAFIDRTENELERMLADLQMPPAALENQPEAQPANTFLSLYDLLGDFWEPCLVQANMDGFVTAVNRKSIHDKLIVTLKILFDIQAAFFFYYDPLNNELVGKSSETATEEEMIDNLKIPVVPNGSLMGLSLLHHKIVDSFSYLTNEVMTIGDDQLIRILGAEGMLCIPLISRQKWIGVIAAAINEPQFPVLWEQLSLLNQFAKHAADFLEEYVFAEMRLSEDITDRIDDISIRRVIHEVNNPLGIIKNYLNILSSKIADPSLAKEEISLIRNEIERIPGIIAQLSRRGYAPGQDIEKVDINSIIYDLSKLLKKSVLDPSSISLHFKPDPRLPLFSGKKNSLIQVFSNLLKNSVEAMPSGGNIFIETAYFPYKKEAVKGDIHITIRDDGPGIPDSIKSHLFEPGQSSKGPEHFGLGLSISKDIIQRCNGVITCESRKNEGTMFKIILPVTE
jgi:signal transduction histidine kinase/HD-like signal output (HDOD) protein